MKRSLLGLVVFVACGPSTPAVTVPAPVVKSESPAPREAPAPEGLAPPQPTLRLPRMRVRGADGQDMERRPRAVDVTVSRPLGETGAGKDSQLDEAVRVLLRKLGRAE